MMRASRPSSPYLLVKKLFPEAVCQFGYELLLVFGAKDAATSLDLFSVEVRVDVPPSVGAGLYLDNQLTTGCSANVFGNPRPRPMYDFRIHGLILADSRREVGNLSHTNDRTHRADDQGK